MLDVQETILATLVPRDIYGEAFSNAISTQPGEIHTHKKKKKKKKPKKPQHFQERTEKNRERSERGLEETKKKQSEMK